MTHPRYLVIDGKAYLWRELIRMRREQLQTIANARQLTLFELKEDSRPETHRTAAGRHLEPSLFTVLENE